MQAEKEPNVGLLVLAVFLRIPSYVHLISDCESKKISDCEDQESSGGISLQDTCFNHNTLKIASLGFGVTLCGLCDWIHVLADQAYNPNFDYDYHC